MKVSIVAWIGVMSLLCGQGALADKAIAATAPSATTIGAASNSTGPADAARAVADAFQNALNRGDRDDVLSVLSDDVLIFEHGGVERSRAEYESHHLAADMKFLEHIETSVSREHFVEYPGVVIFARELQQQGTYKGEPIDRVTTETLVIEQRDGLWRIRHVHWSG